MFLGAAAYTTYNQLVVAHWKETPIISMEKGKNCRYSSNSSGEYYTYKYEVNGVQYQMEDCAHAPSVRVITYDPSNPANAIINTSSVYFVIACFIAGLGIVLMLGAIFATKVQ